MGWNDAASREDKTRYNNAQRPKYLMIKKSVNKMNATLITLNGAHLILYAYEKKKICSFWVIYIYRLVVFRVNIHIVCKIICINVYSKNVMNKSENKI